MHSLDQALPCVIRGQAMKSIGDIKHSAAAGGMSGILATRRADKGQPQELQHSDPQGEAGPTVPARAFRI